MRDRNFEGPARCGEGVGRAVVLRRAERPAIDQQRYAEAAAHRKGLQRGGDHDTLGRRVGNVATRRKIPSTSGLDVQIISDV